jgi:putative transcriptional regulator
MAVTVKSSGKGRPFTKKELARLDALTPEQIEQMAKEDPDNFEPTEEELSRAVFGRNVRMARNKLGLSQAQFADQFKINIGRLRDWEQGRFKPDSVAIAYLKLIEREPEAVRRALAAA